MLMQSKTKTIGYAIIPLCISYLLLQQTFVWVYILRFLLSMTIHKGRLYLIDIPELQNNFSVNSNIHHLCTDYNLASNKNIKELETKFLNYPHYVYGETNEYPVSFLCVRNVDFYKKFVLGGEVGLGESYVNKDWESPDPEKVIRIFITNYPYIERIEYFLSWISPKFWYEYFLRNSFIHSLEEDKDSISAHYDLGTGLFEMFLDPTMTYTSAVWKNQSWTLEQAQQYKIDLLIEKSGAQENDKILEVGCGFGYLASRLANTTGAQVTAITISKDQYEYSKDHYNHNNVEYKYVDYRDVNNSYDIIISVEMIEAIGKPQLQVFFDKMYNILNNGGKLVIQHSIFYPWFFSNYQNNNNMVTFVQKYIFPGSTMPSQDWLHQSAHNSGFDLIHVEQFGGKQYSQTLRYWLNNLYYKKNSVIKKYDENVYRVFIYYLSWSQALYNEEVLSMAQTVYGKNNLRGRNIYYKDTNIDTIVQ